MNKTELIAEVANKSNLTKADAKRAIDSFQELIVEQMKKGEKVTLIGFGTFSVTKREKRQGINPATKKPITIPAKNVVRFKAGKDLKL